ncbi:hypothetical protein ACJJI3_02485 [Microbulbifer sp. ZKSA004]|uniref:hypothetical protein n=1 Tax=Microbulbifer sp. ZKSA004 TaxID=3243389 RepID=UPI00403A3B2E
MDTNVQFTKNTTGLQNWHKNSEITPKIVSLSKKRGTFYGHEEAASRGGVNAYLEKSQQISRHKYSLDAALEEAVLIGPAHR